MDDNGSVPSRRSGLAPEPPNRAFWKYLPVSVLTLLIFLVAALPLRQRTTQPAAAAPASASASPETLARTSPPLPPPGRWRLARPENLRNVVIFISHILIRHRDAEPSVPAFGPEGWSVQPPPPARSVEEAGALASDIAERARRDPSRFAELAREFSEDETTRERGGSLGGIPATQFAEIPTILDVIADMKPGEVSNPVLTKFGLHVVLRRQAPEPAQVSGRHIVIGHDSTDWLRYRQREGRTVHRTREEARQLALDVARQARAAPGRFERLVAAHSDHRDADAGGDLGVWSTREPTDIPRQIDTLAALEVGAISDPIETIHGFEVLERTQVEPRPAFAASVIRFRFEPAAPDASPESKRSVAIVADNVVKTLRRDPARFASVQRQYCCDQPERWTLGRGEPAMTAAAKVLPIGAIARAPILVDNNYLILKRLDPEKLAAEPEATSELPTPARPDLEFLVGHTNGPALARRTREIAEAARAALDLSSEQAAKFTSLHEQLASEFESKTPDERRQVFQNFERELELLLGSDQVERYRDLRSLSVAKILVRN